MSTAHPSPYFTSKAVRFVFVSFLLEYLVLCSITSFYLGSTVLVSCLVLLAFQSLLLSELLDWRHPSTPWFFLTWLVTAMAGIAVGGRNYHANFAPFLAARGGRRYAEVPISAPSFPYADAGVISFEQGAVVDTTRSVGLRIFGHTYCAAPIVAKMNSTEMAQFWAVGLDCCGSRESFGCDEVGAVGVRGGVVVHGPEEGGEEDTSRMILAPRIFYEGYQRAIEAVCVIHEMQAGPGPVLVRWVSDKDDVLMPWFAQTLWVCIGTSMLYCVLAFVILRVVQTPRKKERRHHHHHHNERV